jgi:hypothetical protein
MNSTNMNESLYEIKVSEMFGGKEYVGMCEDLFRFLSIQVMIQLMLTLMDPQNYKLFSEDFLILMLFIVIGVLFYWLVFKKLVSFV